MYCEKRYANKLELN